MKKETRTVVYDDELRIEAYRFEGIVQPFPNHFHEYYVIGFVEGGQRVLFCKNNEYRIEKGNIVIFNPGDNHACVQSDDGTFDYRGFNIPKHIMLDLAEEVTGKRELPGFSKNVIYDDEILTTEHIRSIYKEFIRESIFENMSDEIPYESDVIIDKIEENIHLDKILATVIVEKDIQKKMIIGKNGDGIKRIGIHARKNIEKFSGKKIHLELFVSVKSGWSKNKEELENFGYIF